MVVKPFGNKIISVSNIGSFTHKNIYGLDEEMRLFLFNDTVSLGLHLGFYGDIRFMENRFYYSKTPKKLAITSINLSFSEYDLTAELKAGRFLNGDKGMGIGLSRIFKDIEIGFSGIFSEDEFIGYINFSVPLFPKSRNSLVSYGIAPEKYFRLSNRFSSETLSYEPNKKEKGLEHIVGISFQEIEGLAKPVHFRRMSRISD